MTFLRFTPVLFFWWWSFCFFIVEFSSASSCPLSTCACVEFSKILDCSNRTLDSFPEIRGNLTFSVEKLNLSSNHVTNARFSNFADLVNLKVLDLSNNNRLIVEGDAFSSLTSLETLHLQKCGLAAVPSLKNLRNLSLLNLRENTIGFVSSRDFRSVQSNLRVLDLGQNSLVSIPVDLFGTESQLKILDLSQNEIELLDKRTFRNLGRLEALNLTRNKIRRFPKEKELFMPLARLKHLDLSRNRLRRLDGLSFKGLKELQTLNLDRNGLAVMGDGTFWDMPLLNRLSLANNRLANVDRSWLYGLQSLTTLNLSSNVIARIDVDSWQFCARLQFLDLSNNQLLTLRPRTFHHLRQLRELNLRENAISMIYVNAFESLNELISLDMSANVLADVLVSGQQIFMPLRNLKTLRVASNEIRVLPAGVFDGLTSLADLDLRNNPLIVFSVNAVPMPSRLLHVNFNTTSLHCDCHLAWLIDNDRYGPELQPPKKRSIGGTAECRHPNEWAGKSLLEIPTNVSCGSWPRPQIVAHPRSATGLRGNNVSFECRARCQQVGELDCHMSIHWRINGRLLYPDPEQGLTIESKADDSQNVAWSSKMTIEALDDSDAGSYQCQVASELSSVISENALLVVFVPPRLIKRPVDAAVKVGGTVRLDCKAVGNPPPNLLWRKDSGGVDFPAARDRRMHLMTTDDAFFIVDVKREDAGVYTCVAQSVAGEDTAQARLHVYDADATLGNSGPSVTVLELVVRMGATALLECGGPTSSFTVNDDDEQMNAENLDGTRIRWTRNGQSLLSVPARSYRKANGRVWVIINVQASDQGLYTCRVSSDDGAAAERSWRLVVQASTGDGAKVVSPIGGEIDSKADDEDETNPKLRKNDLSNERSKSSSASSQPPAVPDTQMNIFDFRSTPGVLVMVGIVCVVATSFIWVVVIVWRRRRSSTAAGVAAVVVSLHENGSANQHHQEASLLKQKQDAIKPKQSVQLAAVATF